MRAKALVATAAVAALAVLGGGGTALGAGTCSAPTADHTGQANVTVTATTSSPAYTFTDCDLRISTGTRLHLALGDALAPHTLTSDTGAGDTFDLDTGGATFRFDHPGTFNFHCTYHGTLFGMKGVVRVVAAANRAPTAAFTGPAAAPPGHEVTFDGSASSDPDPGDTLSYHWDLDGDAANGFERVTNTPTVKTTYATAGKRTVRLQVVDTHVLRSNVASRTIDVHAGATIFAGTKLTKRTIQVTSGRVVKLRLRCPATTSGECEGKASIVKPSGPSKSFKIDAGKTATVRLKLSKALFRRLVRKHHLSVRLAIADHDGDGVASGQPRQKLTLKAPAGAS